MIPTHCVLLTQAAFFANEGVGLGRCEAVGRSDARFKAFIRQHADQLRAHAVRGAAHPWAHAGQDDAALCPPESGHLTGCGQFSHDCFGWDVCAYGVGWPCSAGAVGSVNNKHLIKSHFEIRCVYENHQQQCATCICSRVPSSRCTLKGLEACG